MTNHQQVTQTFPLTLEGGHLFIKIGPEWFLIDTGSPVSFTERGLLWLCGRYFKLPSNGHGLTINRLRDYVGIDDVSGLIGNDVLNQFDHVWDLQNGMATVSTGKMAIGGPNVKEISLSLSTHPFIKVWVDGQVTESIFDTGAKVSYFPEHIRTRYPSAGAIHDFHSSVGRYVTPTSTIPMKIGTVTKELRCASYGPLGWSGKNGIIGIDLIKDTMTGYFPRRGWMQVAA